VRARHKTKSKSVGYQQRQKAERKLRSKERKREKETGGKVVGNLHERTKALLAPYLPASWYRAKHRTSGWRWRQFREAVQVLFANDQTTEAHYALYKWGRRV